MIDETRTDVYLSRMLRPVKIGQQRRRHIHMKETNELYTWIPFTHCVCVWNKIKSPATRYFMNAELPAQFARHSGDPVPLSDVACFIKRVLLVDQTPIAEGHIFLLTQEPCPMRKRPWSPIDIIGSFEDGQLAQQESDVRTRKSNICVYRALKLDLYACP